MIDWAALRNAQGFWLTDTPGNTLYTVTEVALALRIGRNVIGRLGIPCRTIGGLKSYAKSDIVAFLESPTGSAKFEAQRVSWLQEKRRRYGVAARRRNAPSLPLNQLGTGPDWDAAVDEATRLANADVGDLGAAKKRLIEADSDRRLTDPEAVEFDRMSKRWDKAYERHYAAEIERRGLKPARR